MSETEERIVQHNLTFRAANEEIPAKAGRIRRADGTGSRSSVSAWDLDCTTIVRMIPSEYEAVRVGEVVARADEYVVVEKDVS